MDTRLSLLTNWKQPSGKNLLILLTSLLGFFSLSLDLNKTDLSFSLSIPLWTSAMVTGVLGYWVVPILQRLKTGQYIQEDGPQTHLKKAGTPTMGGIFFVPVAGIIAIFLSGFDSNVVAVSLVTLAYVGVGWIDDWQVLKLKSNKGISPRMKLLLQIAIAFVFCFWLYLTQPDDITKIYLPWNIVLPLGILFWPLAGFVLVAESNATNITDGVDGLAGGTCAIAFFGLAVLVATTSPPLMIFCACMSGGCLGFVLHNHNPAKVFMGDTGSLSLGAALGAVGILSNNLWGLFIISGLFFVECLSVLAQVGYYKATKGPDGKGKRLLKMAPIHHHIELSGWSETQIVFAFYLINVVLVALSLVFH